MLESIFSGSIFFFIPFVVFISNSSFIKSTFKEQTVLIKLKYKGNQRRVSITYAHKLFKSIQALAS